MYSTLIYNFEPEYKAYLAKLVSLGYTEPSFAEKKISNRLIKRLKQAGLFSRMKTCNLYFYGSLQSGTVNLKDPNTYQHTIVGSPTYVAGKGVRSASSGNYINTQFKTNEYAGIETDLTSILFVNENQAGTNATTYGAYISSASSATRYVLNAKIAGGVNGSYFGFKLNANNFSNYNARGLYIMTQDTGKAILYKDSRKFENNVTIVTPNINNNMLLLAHNTSIVNGGLTATGNFNVPVSALFRFDKFTDADELAFRNIWFQFLEEAHTPTTWYVRPSGGSYGSENGTSYANAWDGFANINWASIGIYDTLYVCGTHTEFLNVQANYFTLRGDYVGDAGIIDATGLNQGLVVIGQSYVTIEGMSVGNATVDCFYFGVGSFGIEVNNCDAYNSGNQAYQNESFVKITYNNCIGRDSVDDGLSLHSDSDVTLNNCEFYNNAQGINGIANSILVANNCYVHDNSAQNIQPQSNADFTANNCIFENGDVNGGSTVPLKLNGCTFISAPITGNVIVT